jgi:hypothetical protein
MRFILSAAFGIDDLEFITRLNKTFPLKETIHQERKMIGLPPMAINESLVDWVEGSRQRVSRFERRDVRYLNCRGMPTAIVNGVILGLVSRYFVTSETPEHHRS